MHEQVDRTVQGTTCYGSLCWLQFLIVSEFAGTEMKICRGSPVFPQLFQKIFSADTCGLFEKEFNGTEKEALKNMSNKSRLFLMIAFESKTNTVHSK